MLPARSIAPAPLALAAAMLAAACLPQPDNRPDANDFVPYPDSETVSIAGYVWDPEAVQYAFGMCGPACTLRPALSPGQTYFERSLVSNAKLDLVEANGTSHAATRTADGGAWLVTGVARQPEPWLFTSAEKPVNGPPFDAGVVDAGDPDAGASDAGASDGGPVAPNPFLGPVPVSSTYYPTVTVSSPIAPDLFQCVGRPAAVFGDLGALDAVARFLTNSGTPTTTADFVDPARYGGVIVWWLYQPGGATTRQGAGGTTLIANAGQTIYVNWACPPGALCPPGAPFPAAGLASKSARNFFVLPGATSSNVGLSVTLLPPGATATVAFVAADPTAPSDGGTRPWRFPVLPTVTPIPGKIMFGQILGLPDLAAEPADWECAPERP